MRSPIRAWRNSFKISHDIRALHGRGSCLAHLSGKRIQSPAIICKRPGRAALGYLSSEKLLTELLHREISPIARSFAFLAHTNVLPQAAICCSLLLFFKVFLAVSSLFGLYAG